MANKIQFSHFCGTEAKWNDNISSNKWDNMLVFGKIWTLDNVWVYRIFAGKVYINDKELKSDVYGITDYIDYPGIAEEPITLGDDEYFCLGDNRPVSQDSRYEEVGPVKRSIIVGKVL